MNYGYDSLYRLTSEAVSSDPNNDNGTTSYRYDSVGNRKQLVVNGTTANTYTYDPDDRLGSDQYDADGNTTNSGGTANTYDFENHMTQHGLVTLVYDGDGNRVSETVGGVTTNYLVDTQNPTGYAQVVDELQTGAVTRSYSYGSERISETQTLNSALATSFYGYDGHGSVRQLTDSTGAVTDSYDYDAFGNLVNSTGSTPNNYLFAGEQFDPALGLYYSRARYLNTATGRFWSMDTEEGLDEQPLTLHKYLYADADPVDGVDPSGNQDNLAEVGAEESMSDTLNAISLPTFNLGTTQNQLTYSTLVLEKDVWEIKWVLAKPTLVGGEIVQHVVINGGCHWLTVPCNAPRASHYDYWEAWEWPPFDSPTTSIYPVYGFDDEFAGPKGAKINAEARFYPGLTLPGSFIRNNTATAAGDLPATIYDPQLSTTNATPPVNRSWVVH